ncbi:hypothetical protein J1N35_043940 [Gossypium stocksii]|uniref:Uncharacterized protein n=1 Tax=Gossypium stocksii TaxID=47602 RepID=A0A9D3U813_9ROSI|nr:hypothetical protein J1N35_043940 [Gossypium stocksii]
MMSHVQLALLHSLKQMRHHIMERIKATLAVVVEDMAVVVVVVMVVVMVKDVDVNDVVISKIPTKSGIKRMERMIKIQWAKWKICVIVVEVKTIGHVN